MYVFNKVAVVGSGVIGRSWTYLFARGGCETRVYDTDPAQREGAMAWIHDTLKLGRHSGFISDAEAGEVSKRIAFHDTLKGVVDDADYVQENGPEKLSLKRELFAKIDQLVGEHTIVASSTSALDITEITQDLAGAARCLIAHPVNPPHVIPLVEILPGASTSAEVVARASAFLADLGQKPVVLKRYAKGFVLNRLQAALLREAVHLVHTGIADVATVDAAVREGLGLRWALMGPFEVAQTNADGGIREYLTRFGDAYRDIMDDLGPTPTFNSELIETIARGTDAMLGCDASPDRQRQRDGLISALRALKQRTRIAGGETI